MVALSDMDANQLLNWIRQELNLRSDRLLGEALGVKQPMLSRLRTGRSRIGPTILVRILDQTGVKLRDLPTLIQENSSESTGVPRRQFSLPGKIKRENL